MHPFERPNTDPRMHPEAPVREPTEAERRAGMTAFDEAFKAAFEADPALRQSLRGEVQAFLLGLKPALLRSSPEQVQKIRTALTGVFPFSSYGKQVLFVPGAVLDRVAREPELAKHIGWNTADSLETNISRIDLDPNFLKKTATLGFLLGYPESAIRFYERSRQLEEERIPSPDYFSFLRNYLRSHASKDDASLLSISESGEHNDALKASMVLRYRTLIASPTIGPRLRVVLDTLETITHKRRLAFDELTSRNLPPDQRSAEGERIEQEIFEATKPSVAWLYETMYHLDPTDIDLFLRKKTYRLKNPDGEDAFSFAGACEPGTNGDDAHDVVLLRERMAKAYASLPHAK